LFVKRTKSDSTTVAEMLSVLQKRVGKTKDATVVVDRGMSNPENLAAIRAAGYHWLVAAAQPERVCYFDQLGSRSGAIQNVVTLGNKFEATANKFHGSRPVRGARSIMPNKAQKVMPNDSQCHATLAPCPKESYRNKFMSCAVAQCSSDSLVAPIGQRW
jgi:hypothetical protein